MYIFPLGVLVFGALFPLGLLFYWLANNGWTLMQQRLVYTKIDKEEETKKVETIEKRAALGPKPGQKPAVGQKPVQQKKSSNAGQVKKVTKPGSPHGFAESTSTPKNGMKPGTTGGRAKKQPGGTNSSERQSSKENGSGAPGLIGDSTKKSGRKRR
jgi:YidC/Oxa1 family membrane protein insertase